MAFPYFQCRGQSQQKAWRHLGSACLGADRKRLLYLAFVLSQLGYASEVWAPQSCIGDLKLLEGSTKSYNFALAEGQQLSSRCLYKAKHQLKTCQGNMTNSVDQNLCVNYIKLSNALHKNNSDLWQRLSSNDLSFDCIMSSFEPCDWSKSYFSRFITENCL